jgi:hypothetical protein
MQGGAGTRRRGRPVGGAQGAAGRKERPSVKRDRGAGGQGWTAPDRWPFACNLTLDRPQRTLPGYHTFTPGARRQGRKAVRKERPDAHGHVIDPGRPVGEAGARKPESNPRRRKPWSGGGA